MHYPVFCNSVFYYLSIVDEIAARSIARCALNTQDATSCPRPSLPVLVHVDVGTANTANAMHNLFRSYLTRLLATRTGLSTAEAQRRVETAIVNTTENISRARKSTVILAFMAGAAALLGAAAAWFAAAAGGKHRDHAAPAVAWSLRGPRVIRRVEASLRQR